jgi:hypothetical protein
MDPSLFMVTAREARDVETPSWASVVSEGLVRQSSGHKDLTAIEDTLKFPMKDAKKLFSKPT